jgi:hypothetical protein
MRLLKRFQTLSLSAVVIYCASLAAQVHSTETTSWAKDLRTVGYPARLNESFLKTFGSPPTKLVFADPEHVVITSVSADPNTRSEQEGRPDSFSLRLHIVVLESRTGEVDTKQDWPTPNAKDGVIAGHDGRVIVRAGGKLTLYDTSLEALKVTDTSLDKTEKLFSAFSSPSSRFLLLEFTPSIRTEYSWMNADTLEKIHTFSESLFLPSVSNEEMRVGGVLPHEKLSS